MEGENGKHGKLTSALLFFFFTKEENSTPPVHSIDIIQVNP